MGISLITHSRETRMHILMITTCCCCRLTIKKSFDRFSSNFIWICRVIKRLSANYLSKSSSSAEKAVKKSDEKSFLFLSIYFFFYSSIPHWDVKNKDTLQCNYYVYPNKTDTKSNDFLFMSFACTFPTPPSSSFDRQYYWETEAAFRLMRRPRVPVRTISLIDCSWAISNRRYSACCDFQLWQKNQKFIKNSIKAFCCDSLGSSDLTSRCCCIIGKFIDCCCWNWARNCDCAWARCCCCAINCDKTGLSICCFFICIICCCCRNWAFWRFIFWSCCCCWNSKFIMFAGTWLFCGIIGLLGWFGWVGDDFTIGRPTWKFKKKD